MSWWYLDFQYLFTRSTEQNYKVLDGEGGQNIGDALENYIIWLAWILGSWFQKLLPAIKVTEWITCVADMKV